MESFRKMAFFAAGMGCLLSAPQKSECSEVADVSVEVGLPLVGGTVSATAYPDDYSYYGYYPDAYYSEPYYGPGPGFYYYSGPNYYDHYHHWHDDHHWHGGDNHWHGGDNHWHGGDNHWHGGGGHGHGGGGHGHR